MCRAKYSPDVQCFLIMLNLLSYFMETCMNFQQGLDPCSVEACGSSHTQ